MVPSNHAATELRLEGMENLNIAFVLHDGEFRKNLIAEFQSGILVDPDVKTAFTVHETCDPLCVKVHSASPGRRASEGSRCRIGSSLRIVPVSAGL
jgi:hypothetical protein